MRVHDTPRSTRAVGQAEDRVALARPQIVAVGAPNDATVRRIDREELIRSDAFLVDAARCEEKAAVARWSTDAATGPGHPTATMEVAEELDEELSRRLLIGRRGMQRHGTECRGHGDQRISQRSREYIAGAIAIANVSVR